MIRRALPTALAAVLAFLGACGKDEGVSIAVIPKGTTHVFWKSIHAGAEKAAREFGVKVVWQGPQKEDDREMQINVVQNFISRGTDAIVLAPLDETALVRPVTAALRRNIPVVIIDSDLKDSSYTSFVATDNYRGGGMAAERMIALLEGKGRVLMMRYAEGSASTTKREQGFLDALHTSGSNIELVSADQYGGVTAESALQVGQNLLNKYPDLDGIFCPNESTTFGMLRALKIAGKAGSIVFVGFDTSEPLLQGLRDREIHGLVAQNPFKMGYLGVKIAYAAVKGEPIDKRIDTGVQMVTVDNLDEPSVREAIAPDIDRWLAR